MHKVLGAPSSTLAESDSIKHKQRRASLEPLFAKKNILQLEPMLMEQVDYCCQRFDEHFAADKPVSAYKLDTPSGVHPAFYVALFNPRNDDPLSSQQVHHTENPSIKVDGHDEYEVEPILRHRRRGKGFQYNVKWLGWSRSIWDPAVELEYLDE